MVHTAPQSNAWQWVALVLRVLIGGLFVLTGTLKILAPLEGFQALIREYQFLPVAFVPAFSVILPIAEVALGAALIAGIFERWSALGICIMTAMFLIAITAGLARGISLENCGCFGSFKFGDGPLEVLMRDWILLLAGLLIAIHPSRRFALDNVL